MSPTADTLLVFAAGGGTGDYNAIGNLKKDTILFVRHKSGPVYLWYEIISPRYLRQHTDTLKTVGIDDQDVVVDRMDEVLWRLRALCGLKNTIGSRIVAIGGLAGWAQPTDAMAKLIQERWKLDVRPVEYPQLGELIKAARADQAVVERSKKTGRRIPGAAPDCPGNGKNLRRKRVPAGGSLPAADEGSGLPGNYRE